MHPQIILGQVASAASHLVYLDTFADREPYARPNRAAVRACPFQAKDDPVPVRLVGEFEKRWWLVLVVDYNLDRAIIVVIAKRCPPSGMALSERGTRSR